MKNRIVLIIPYFGQFPNYFDLWIKSAEANKSFDFFIYTDQHFPSLSIKGNNIKIVNTSFQELVKKIKNKLGNVVINKPYKLCDYKPCYGCIFEDDIADYDYWGFCDIDLIFGNLESFITDDLLNEYDKLFFHGHFCLMKNCDKMRYLWKREYKSVLSYKVAFMTNYVTHFDESATIAFASEKSTDIKQYTNDKLFYNPIWNLYELKGYRETEERICLWENGVLTLLWNSEGCIRSKEVMYVHLMKRTMRIKIQNSSEGFMFYRDVFSDLNKSNFFELVSNKDKTQERIFNKTQKRKRIKQIIENLKSGAIKMRILDFIYRFEKK